MALSHGAMGESAVCDCGIPTFYGYLLQKLKKIVGTGIFSAQFIKIASHYKKIGFLH